MLQKADNQPVVARPLGDAIWVTDLITPNNPDVVLKYRELTSGLYSTKSRITALWRYVANLPYRQTIRARVHVDGKSLNQRDSWLFPSETIRVRTSNCANRAFLLTSLLKNEMPRDGEVYAAMGYINLDGIGAHAWCSVNISGESYILETTQPRLESAFIPVSEANAYDGVIAFDKNNVYTIREGADIAEMLNAQFGLCSIKFLEQYLCERCLGLEG